MTRKRIAIVLAVAMIFAQVGGGVAVASFITNGNFADNTGVGQLGYANTQGGTVIQATGWSSTGYNMIFASSDPGTSYTGQYGHSFSLWGGTGTGVSNGLVGPPDGNSYFIGSDGAADNGPLYQMMTGLTVNNTYTVSFWMAGAQQYGFTGATTEAWQVTCGSQTVTTTPLSNVSQGFTGWVSESINFVATSSQEMLTFLAVGTPGSGEPPFSLLDGVNVTQAVPEPSSLLMMSAGLFGCMLVGLRKHKSRRASA